SRSKRQLDVTVVAPEAAKDAHFVDEDASAIPTPIHVPQLPPPAAKIINTKDGQVRGGCTLAIENFRSHTRDVSDRGLVRPAPPQPR
nr:hypothetical protein [Tanacetum cinerariifolium]